jgi:NADH-quinone oxidoreductase subunit J
MTADAYSVWLIAADPAASLDATWLNELWRVLSCATCWGFVIGSLALWLLIPGGFVWGRWNRWVGGVLVAISGILFAVDLPLLGNMGEQLVFWSLAVVTLGSGVAMISARSPVYSALWFALLLMGTAGLFLMQGAQFLGVATIAVYAGAIVVTFLFVVMLAQPEGHAVYDRISWGWLPRPAAILTAAILMAFLAAAMSGLKSQAALAPEELATERLVEPYGVLDPQHMANLGRHLFTGQLVAIEVAGTLLMAALVGAIAIAIHGKHPHRQQQQARFAEAVGDANASWRNQR